MRHRLWILTVASVMAAAIWGQAAAQAPMTVPYATISAGQPSYVAQASFRAGGCGACDGSGCGICQGSCTGCNGCDSCSSGLGAGAPGFAGPSVPLPIFDAGRHGGYATQSHGQENGPFGGGGCCTPIWYDFHVEWMNLRRDDVGDSIGFTSRNAGGPIVLSTDDLDLEDANGFRATYALNFGPSSNLEASYFGTHNWDDSAAVTGNGDLYSIFSKYGTDPIDTSDPNNPVIGFPGTVDAANLHSIAYSSELHNVEVNLRRRWVSANCLLHGSYLAGVRYVSLQEALNHHTEADGNGFLNYDVETQNDAVGFQIGADLYVCMTPRFKLGVEVEGGIYSNDAEADTNVSWRDGTNANSPVESLVEAEDDRDVAFVGELGGIALFRLTPRLTLRGGYQLLYMDGMALATENFNVASPLMPRASFVNNDGDAFLHGATAGFTWMW